MGLRLAALRCFAATSALLFSVGPAKAISDDANPWLAIENALCVVHRTVDYSVLVGAPVRLDTAEWTGALNGLPTHCHLAGMMDGEPFDIKVPMTWNGQVFPAGCDAATPSASDSTNALTEGEIAAFGAVSGRAVKLLRAVSAQQRDGSFSGTPCD